MSLDIQELEQLLLDLSRRPEYDAQMLNNCTKFLTQLNNDSSMQNTFPPMQYLNPLLTRLTENVRQYESLPQTTSVDYFEPIYHFISELLNTLNRVCLSENAIRQRSNQSNFFKEIYTYMSQVIELKSALCQTVSYQYRPDPYESFAFFSGIGAKGNNKWHNLDNKQQFLAELPFNQLSSNLELQRSIVYQIIPYQQIPTQTFLFDQVFKFISFQTQYATEGPNYWLLLFDEQYSLLNSFSLLSLERVITPTLFVCSIVYYYLLCSDRF